MQENTDGYMRGAGKPQDGRIIKIVPKKFKENFELEFRDLVKNGPLKKQLVDQQEERKKVILRQKEHDEALSRAKRLNKPFDLVEIENEAFNKLYVGPPSSHELHNQHLLNNDKIQQETTRAKSQMRQSPGVSLINQLKVSRYPRAPMPSELKSRFEVEVSAYGKN